MMAAKGVWRCQNSYGEFYRKMKARHGPQKALTATAHKIARTVYSMLKNGTAYEMKRMKERETRSQEKRVVFLQKEVAKVGGTMELPSEAKINELAEARLAAAHG
jgi:predicted transcriptional regulator